VADKNTYAGTDVVGRTEEVKQQIVSGSSISKTFGGIMSQDIVSIEKWLGIITRPTKLSSPLGALESVKNLKFNKVMNAMCLRDGTSSYLNSFIDIAGKELTILNNYFALSTETPSAQNIDLICGQTDEETKYIFQKPFYHDSSDPTDSFVDWGESLSGITIKSVSSNSVVFTGGSTTQGYYKGWILRNSTIGNILYVLDSSFSAGDTTLTIFGYAPSNWTTSNNLVLYRNFHDNYSFSPTYSTVSGRPPVALQQGNALLFSGGMGSDVGLKPIWSGYIDKTFFVGATNETGGVPYKGTYVTEAEIKNSNGMVVNTASITSETTNPLTAGRWFYCIVPETDDGLRGNPIYNTVHYVDITTNQKFSFTVIVDFARLNKRLRYLNVFVGKAPNDTDATIDWNSLVYLQRLDMLSSDFSWVETVTVTAGHYLSKAITVSNAEWNDKSSESLALHLGHTECTSTTASFSEAVFLNNRLFIAKYYDYVDAIEYLDQIRYTDFAGNGKAQLNVLCNLEGSTQSTIEQGDPTSVQALRRWQDKLFILKDKSCYYIPISDDVTQWMLVTVSNEVGCTIPATAVVTPTMVIWCQNGEDIYGWEGANVFSLGQNWLTTFKALNLTDSQGWYDIKNKSYNFHLSASEWYTMFLECPIPNGFVWAENMMGLTLNTNDYEIIDVSSRNTINYVLVFDSGIGGYSILYFDSSATSDNSHFGIIPYFKTAESRLSETDILKILKWYLTLNPTGGSGQLDCKLTIGSGTVTYANMTKTLSLHSKWVPISSGLGRSFAFEFNTNASRATFTGLDVYGFKFDYEMIPFIGDKTIT
jgi:hypothetical protein